MIPVRPVDNYLIVRREIVEATKGGILLAQQSDLKSGQRGLAAVGIVLAIGEGAIHHITEDGQAVREPLPCKVGDKVLFSAMAGLELGEGMRSLMPDEENIKAIHLLKVADIMGVVEAVS